MPTPIEIERNGLMVCSLYQVCLCVSTEKLAFDVFVCLPPTFCPSQVQQLHRLPLLELHARETSCTYQNQTRTCLQLFRLHGNDISRIPTKSSA